jgi:hypothetical protein
MAEGKLQPLRCRGRDNRVTPPSSMCRELLRTVWGSDCDQNSIDPSIRRDAAKGEAYTGTPFRSSTTRPLGRSVGPPPDVRFDRRFVGADYCHPMKHIKASFIQCRTRILPAHARPACRPLSIGRGTDPIFRRPLGVHDMTSLRVGLSTWHGGGLAKSGVRVSPTTILQVHDPLGARRPPVPP